MQTNRREKYLAEMGRTEAESRQMARDLVAALVRLEQAKHARCSDGEARLAEPMPWPEETRSLIGSALGERRGR